MKIGIALLALSLSALSCALVLDDFSTGSYLSDGRGTFDQTGAMIGGARRVSGYFDDLDDTTQAVGTVSVDPAVGLAMTANAGRPSEFEQILTYPGLEDLDLGGYRAVRFEFSRTDFTRYFPNQPDLTLGVNVATVNGGTYRGSLKNVEVSPSASPSVVEIAFADFVTEPGYAPVDWRDVDALGLYLGGTGKSGGSLVLRRVEFVPVPEPAPLAVLGFAALALRRRGRRSKA